MMPDPQKIFKYGFFAMIVVLILMLVFKGRTSGDKLYEQVLEDKIELLNHDISVLDDKNRLLQVEINVLSDSLGILDQKAKENENKRKAAINYYEKRIKALNDLTVHELDSFFAARYRFSSDTAEASSH